MTNAFVAPGLPLATSSFTRSPAVTRHAPSVRVRTRRVARMLGEPPAAPEPVEGDGDAASAEVTLAEMPVTEEPLGSIATGVEPEDSDEESGDVAVCEPPQFVLNAQAVNEAREKFRVHETDSGSPEYQIATLSTRIGYLTNHLKQHPKDHSCTRGLLKLVATRRRLLKYLKREDVQRFNNIVQGLNIRISQQLREL